jgi:hypothetical protein
MSGTYGRGQGQGETEGRESGLGHARARCINVTHVQTVVCIHTTGKNLLE